MGGYTLKIFILDTNKANAQNYKEMLMKVDFDISVEYITTRDRWVSKVEVFKPNVLLICTKDSQDTDILFDELKYIKSKLKDIKIIPIVNGRNKYVIGRFFKMEIEYLIKPPVYQEELGFIINKIKKDIYLQDNMEKIKLVLDSMNLIYDGGKDDVDYEDNIKSILVKLGIIGENGSEDIIKITKYLIDNNINIFDVNIRDICLEFTDNPRSMEQKIRRAINSGMSNLASLGIEDYMNETFIEYSNTLFNFEQIKKEMDYIRGKSQDKGSINLKKFISGLMFYCENSNN